ncbi:uncharacterized protein LOC123311865 isoform X3 [Coccinella septempunctata]|uniref:uncharacterized protein LOC123311865 isoform X3 n=1 Tax=Coccinella septempunctata TaxID=41139 RepID=UPI001D06BB33|nr:uncharacterized protein LOC123311865 isoform X3 [Coccinella septempunctata]
MSPRRCEFLTHGFLRIFDVCSCYLRVVLRMTRFQNLLTRLFRYMNDDSNNNNNNNNNAGYCGELINEQETSEDKVIETVDLATNEIVNFKENILNYQGKTYLLRDISYKWKKDCRMWLWKNRPSTHKEIGDLCNNQNITITTLA